MPHYACLNVVYGIKNSHIAEYGHLRERHIGSNYPIHLNGDWWAPSFRSVLTRPSILINLCLN